MERMPLILRPRLDEPGHGVLARLGARNGYKSARRFAASLGFDFRKSLAGSYVADLAFMAGLAQDPVKHCSAVMVTPGRRVRLYGQEIPLREWSTRDRRYCPMCHALDHVEARRLHLQPEWYVSHRAVWDIRIISACPVHGVELTGSCHNCNKDLDWETTNTVRCAHCLALLSSAPTVPVFDAVGTYVACRLNGQTGSNEVLDALPLWDAVRLCERLGQIDQIGAVATLPRQNRDQLQSARAAGFQMIASLEQSVFASFDAIVRQKGHTKGLLSTYGWIYGEWLARDEPPHAPVRKLLFQHAARNGVVSDEEPRLGNNPTDSFSMTQAARALGMSYKRARRITAEAGLVPLGSRHGVAFTLNPSAVKRLGRDADAATTIRETANMLGTGKAQVADLLAAGLLSFGTQGGVSSDSITQLCNRLDGQGCKKLCPKGSVRITTAARDAALPLWRIVQAACDGRLKFWSEDEIRLSTLKVRLTDVMTLRVDRHALSVEAAARRIGVHHDCARALVKCGSLVDEQGIVTEDSVNKFNKHFIAGSRIAKSLGQSPRSLHRTLSKLGVAPAFNLEIFRQVLYCREDIVQFDLPT